MRQYDIIIIKCTIKNAAVKLVTLSLDYRPPGRENIRKCLKSSLILYGLYM